MLPLAHGIIRLEHRGAGLWSALGALTAGPALVAAFIVIERRARTPLVPPGIFRKAAMVRADLAALLFLGAAVPALGLRDAGPADGRRKDPASATHDRADGGVPEP
ncbi:hypothetical protein ACIO87_30320 [Streptomyces sp. NPDC087218]|uniref:hypothetical protein n=1 Tax=Streptomyces sp. NPDC087218 TaxID=3365769 RepID=UPI003807B4FA